jgi:murein DD-endopeptidase MepM/ murein hydrolase activator NlpD
LNLDPAELARHNALPPETTLRDGEVLALPRRVEPGPAGGSGMVDVGAIATTALDRVDTPPPAATLPATGPEPVRHTVLRGETAFTIARLYNVTPRALADWNGLGADMAVREGQTLMIPVPQPEPQRTAAAAPPVAPPPPASPPPGAGSPTPTPPSAARPLPQDDPAVAPAPAAPPSPDLGEQRTTTAARLAMPVDGRIIREFQPGRSDGITIAASAGSPVRAAADGTVANITRDTSQNQFVILRHDGNLLTVYANIDNIQVERGQQVRRGQQIGAVQDREQAGLIFQVRDGIDSVDPVPLMR